MGSACWKKLGKFALSSALSLFCFYQGGLIQVFPAFSAEINHSESEIEQLAKLTTVRIVGSNVSGSGVIVGRNGDSYLVLTNRHVIAFGDQFEILTSDGNRYPLHLSSFKFEGTDLAVVKFFSSQVYEVAAIREQPIKPGEQVYASGFPMYKKNSLTTTLEQGIEVFVLTSGEISLWLSKPLDEGYRLGYTNDIQKGMSGGPIFDQSGQLVGINGRLKHRDPAFGVYGFADGTQPSPMLLNQMIALSWGIPINIYLQVNDREKH